MLALVAASACSSAEPGPETPRRIFLIVADTLRRDHLSAYGSSMVTPNVARLAENGQVFWNAFASFHMTTMSMGAMFTGRTPSLEVGDGKRTLPWTSRAWCGMARLATSPDDACVPDHLGTLAEDLRDAGYETLAVVSNRLLFAPIGFEQGFERWHEVGSKEEPKGRKRNAEVSLLHSGARVNEAVVRVLSERRSDRFFLYVHFLDPHDYYIRPDLSHYASGVLYFDRVLGDLLDHLEQEDLLEDSLLVFTSDHGEHLGKEHPVAPARRHYGNPSYGEVLRVPLIVVPPTSLDSARLIRSQDVRGLVRELTGLPGLPPADIDADEVLLSETYYQTYHRGRWKSMRLRGKDDVVLYDLERNPGETRDVAAENPEVVAAHEERVHELTQRLGTRNALDAKLSADDEQRLRALGYLE